LLAALACGLAAGLAAAPASSDLVLETQTRFPDSPEGAFRHGQIWLDGSRIRMEFADTRVPERVATVIFRGDRDLYWALDAETRSYVQIDREEVVELGRRVARAREEMSARLAELPPDQRATVEQMLADMQPAEPARGEEKIVATQVRGKRDGLPTRLHRMMIDSEMVGEIWTVDWDHVDAGRLDFRAFKKLAEFQRQLLSSLGESAGSAFGGEPFEVFDQLDGYPLRVRRLSDGVMEAETRFALPRRVPAQPGRYEPPEGYVRRAGPGGSE
jgi:hypothetical protein